MPRGLEFWSVLNDAFEAAVAAASKRVHQSLRPRRHGNYTTLKPGFETPLWNVCATMIKRELKPYGSKIRLARYPGIPKQRPQDFINGKSRMPDAELTLRLLYWLAAKRDGSDQSL